MRFRLASLAALILAGVAQPALADGYHLTATAPLGAPDKWDYVAYDGPSRRVYVAHGSEVTVLDAEKGGLVGRVGDLDKVHGVAFVAGTKKGYATNGGGVTVFDLTSLATLGFLPTAPGADGIAYDGSSHRLFVMNGKAHSVSILDPKAGSVVATTDVGGKPEAAVGDGQGGLFVNVEDTGEIIRLDTQTAKLTTRWALPGCVEPHGLAYDAKSRHLFASCANSQVIAIDAVSGKITGTQPIGEGSDTVVFDGKRRILFSSNGDGSLSRIAVDAAGALKPLPSVPTRPTARTMALDAQSGRVFLVAGQRDANPAPSIVPGNLSLMIWDQE
jgi:DNA-binding beta-propeller fold protein YncE